jgi:hypothetical protein
LARRRLPGTDHETSSISETKTHEVSRDTLIASSLLDSAQHRQMDIRPEHFLYEGIRFDADDGPAHGNATRLPAIVSRGVWRQVTTITGVSRAGQLAIAGRLTAGSSLKVVIVSRVM